MLTPGDVEEASRLSTLVGWNQTKVDWLRLVELNPDTCFRFQQDAHTVGTATLAVFGADLAWIGMVIVDEPFRGRGAGRHILEAVIAEARERGIRVIGLDATDQGRRMYLRYGFHDVQPIDRWAGRLTAVRRAGGSPEGHVDALDERHAEEAALLDSECCGIDRTALLRRLLREESTRGLAYSRGGLLRGFAFLRPGRQFHHVGPVLAETDADFAALLDESARVLRSEPVLVDTLRRESTSVLLEARGLDVQRRLTRMTLGAAVPVTNDPRVRAAVAFEWG